MTPFNSPDSDVRPSFFPKLIPQLIKTMVGVNRKPWGVDVDKRPEFSDIAYVKQSYKELEIRADQVLKQTSTATRVEWEARRSAVDHLRRRPRRHMLGNCNHIGTLGQPSVS